MLSNFRHWLWKSRKKFPLANGIYETIRGRVHPIFLEFPVNTSSRCNTQPRFPKILHLLSQNDETYGKNLQSFLAFAGEFASIPNSAPKDSPIPRWNNETLPALDGMAIYSFLRQNNPSCYLEIGIGNSTKFARHAISTGNLKTKIVTIDLPSRNNGHELSDQVIRTELQVVPEEIFRNLSAGDILFYDGSHLVFPNSDVVVFFLDILPKLPAGVWVQIHDICLPGDYGTEFADRYWNEQYLLGAWILGGGNGMEIQLPMHYVWADKPELISNLAPLFDLPSLSGVNPTGASFWFKTVGN